MEELQGNWLTLTPLSAENALGVSVIDDMRALSPQMGGLPRRGSETGVVMAVLEISSGTVVGTVEAHDLPGYPGVVSLVIYLAPALSRPGYAIEALLLFVPSIFGRGTEVIHLEVLEFNRTMLAMVRRWGLQLTATMRDHAYVAGHFWDVLVFSLDEDIWSGGLSRYLKRWPGRERGLAALGGSNRGR
jgi:RimJ/RimL family protein N-acetyltransferase